MTSYDMVKGFAPMIREVVRTQRMPPWDVDPHYSAFSNDRGLSSEQARTLVHWLEGRLAARQRRRSAPLAEEEVAAVAARQARPDRRAAGIQGAGDRHDSVSDAEGREPARPRRVGARDGLVAGPAGRRASHHRFGGRRRAARRDQPQQLRAGRGAAGAAAGSGILLPGKSTFHFQVHYTSNGKELLDRTKMGLYFRPDAPKYMFRSLVFANNKLRIPPNTKLHEETAEQTLKADAILYTLHPHAHYRGKSSRFVAYYPDGREQTLLNIPAYDFNWQGTYELIEPMKVPAGTRIVYTQWYDNSTQNKANPDANREVTWGEQTWDEMIFGVIRYRNVTEDAKAPTDKGPSQEELFTERQARQ